MKTTLRKGVVKTPSIKMIRSLRNMGYNNYDAILDILDNAIDAKADKISIEVESGKLNTVRNIHIADNGKGMNREILLEAVRLGSETPHSTNDLGKFGMGLSTASLSLTESALVTSKTISSSLMTVHQDLNIMENENDFVYPIHEARRIQQNKFSDMLGQTESGTLVSLLDCDNVRHKFDTFVENLRTRIGRQFRVLFQNGLEIVVNGLIVKPEDFLQLDILGTVVYYDDMIDISYTDNKGKMLKDKIRIRIAKLGNSAYNLSQSTQGFSIIRNGREITFNQRLDLWTKHPQYNKLRGEIYFTDALDEPMGVNVDKSKIDITEETLLQIKEAIGSIIDKVVKDLRLEMEQRKRKKEEEEGKTPTHEESSKRIVQVEKPKIDKENEKKKKGKKNAKETSEKGKEQPKIVEWETGSHGLFAPIFQSYKKGKTVVVEYNQDHKFYDRFVVGTQHDKELQTEVDMLIYSMASAKESFIGDEHASSVIDDFMQHIGTKLAKLLDKE